MAYEEDENKQRGNWTGQLDFLLSCIGFAVGLGNIWRFPYLCYRNGGAAFLIPYIFMLVCCGLPLFLFELIIGQFSSQGPLTVWKLCPIFSGIGWGMISISAMVCVYYNVVIAYAVYYMFVSFVNMDSVLPWTGCDNTWNTDMCRVSSPDFEGLKSNETARIIAAKAEMDLKCVQDISYKNGTTLDFVTGNSTILLGKMYETCKLAFRGPSDEYWNRQVLMVHEADGIDDMSEMSWKIFVSNLFTWLIVFFCLMKGIKSSGRVVYFTATFPYVMLIVLLVRGVTLPGYLDGIKFYIVPTQESWEKLKEPQIWRDAATQIFYSLGPAWGGLLTMSSYNRFKNNCYRDAVIVACVNCGTSIFGGFAIFSMLGYMAHETNQKVSEVATSGPGLTFIAYPAGIAQLPGAAVWGFLFFFMLLTLGLDSQFAMMETVISGLVDQFPRLRPKKTLFTFFLCVCGFLLAIPQCTKGGIYVLTLMDWYSGSYGVMLIGLFEIVSVAWIYGVRNLSNDLKMMIGYKPNIYWLATWVFVAPVCMVFILITAFINYSKAYYSKSYIFEDWAQGVGWAMVALPVACVVFGVIIQIIRYTVKGGQGLIHGIKAAAHHTEDWGPALNRHRALDPDRYPPLAEDSETGYGLKYAVNDGYENDLSTKM